MPSPAELRKTTRVRSATTTSTGPSPGGRSAASVASTSWGAVCRSTSPSTVSTATGQTCVVTTVISGSSVMASTLTGRSQRTGRRAKFQLQPQPGGGVVVPDRALLDVTPHHRGRPPAAVAHDRQLGRALGVALGGEPGPQRVAAEGAVEASGGGPAFDHIGHGAVAEAPGAELSMSVDRPERRAGLNTRD